MAEEAAVQAVSDSQSSSVVYDSEEETLKDYHPGGYHPVRINDLFLDRYIIKQKLGWGHFSTVWLCLDTKFDTYVAMKVQKSAANYTEAANDEIEILQKVADNFKSPLWVESLRRYFPADQEALSDARNAPEFTFVVQLLNSFLHVGENGKHVCMVFEILGVNLLEIIKRFNYKGIPIPICRIISKQILIGLDYLHRICGIIHTDLKPENVLVELTQTQIREILFPGENETVVNRLQTPITELAKEVEMTEEERKILAKKQKKKEKRKKYKQRKKETLKQTQPHESVLQAVQPKKKKKKRKKKPEPAVQQIVEVSAEPSRKSSVDSEEPKRLHSCPLKSLEPVDEKIRVKIADLGNACWLDQHFSTEIQTRQYRSPEVILGISYNATADIWSFACMLFELITGDFLFDPKSGAGFDKDDDHLGQMIETLGEFPRSFALSGVNSRKLFTKAGKIKNIHQLRYWKLKDVLVEKYHFRPSIAVSLSSFLLPMLAYRPEARATAAQMLTHPWLTEESSYDCRMSEEEIDEYDQTQADALQRKKEMLMQDCDWESSPDLSRREEEEDADADDELFDFDEDDFSEDEALPEVADLVNSSHYHQTMQTMRHSLIQ